MAFLKYIEAPEEIAAVFHHMTADLYNETQGKQLPELSSPKRGQRHASLCAVVRRLPAPARTTEEWAATCQPRRMQWRARAALRFCRVAVGI
jgi:hypothetical protein